MKDMASVNQVQNWIEAHDVIFKRVSILAF
jgi:hypothetical protein